MFKKNRFLPYGRILRHSDVTRTLLVLILVDMDRGDKDLYKGTKNSIIEPLLFKIYQGRNNNPPPVRYVTKKNTKQNKNKRKQTNKKKKKTAW